MGHVEHETREAGERVRYELALDAARIGTWTWDPSTDRVEWDAQMAACFGMAADSFDGSFAAYLEAIHPDDRDRVAALVGTARDTGSPLTFEHRAIWPDGSVHWLEARGRDVRAPDGALLLMVGVGIDIDERKHLEMALEETMSLRAAALLTEQLEAAERLAQLGSWYWDARENLVTLSKEMQRLCGGDIPSSMTGQEFREVLRERAHPDDVEILATAPAEALRDRDSFWVEQRLVDVGGGERHVLHRGEVLVGEHDDVLGLRGTTQDVTRQRRAELELLETRERLVRERRAVEVLHETLIRPDFPEIPGYEVSATYSAPPNEPEVGGDWYDAFELGDGRVVLAIGDVSGHGVRAARLMAKLRHATRAYAVIEPDLASILARLDLFVRRFALDEEFATVALGLLDPRSGVLELASAGHLPPLVLDGSMTPWFAEEPVGVVLGPAVGDVKPRTVVTITVEVGGSVVFYTDGLVERRGESLDAGLRRLADAATGQPPGSAHTLRAAIVATCLEGSPTTDDACLLILTRAEPTPR